MRSLSFSGWNRDGQYPWSGDRISIAARLFAVLQMEQLLGRGGGNATLTRTGVARHLRVGKVIESITESEKVATFAEGSYFQIGRTERRLTPGGRGGLGAAIE